MKKVLLGLLIALLVVGILGAMGYVIFFMEEDPDTVLVDNEVSSQASSQTQPEINVHKKAETPADVLEALDYEISANRDTVGWLEVPGTEINGSVLQAHDNTAYLRRNERKEYDLYGCYFVDYECNVSSREELSPNTVIYGHSDLTDQPDGPRFSQLFHFTDPEFAKNTPVIRFSTLDSYMNWQIFAVLYTDLEFNFIDPEPEDGVDQMAATAMEKSIYDYGVTVGEDDHVLVLSTCTIKYGKNDRDHRFVIMAKLLPEDAEIPTEADITPRDPSASAQNVENTES